MGSKEEYERDKKMRDLRDQADEAALKLAIAAPGLLERFVIALETIAEGNAIKTTEYLD